MTTNKSAALQAREVTVRRGGATLLASVSIQLYAGELVALVGPNGAGKSTLLKALSGEVVPDAGSVRLHGRELRDWLPRHTAQVRAVLPQASNLSFSFTALEVVQFGRLPHRTRARDHEIALAALALTDCSALAERDYLTLSGGEKARVQLARALAQVWEPGEPPSAARVLLLDEPTAALDLKHQHAVLRIARERTRNEQAFAALAVLHDLNLAAQYADRIVLMYQGKIVDSGPPAQVLTSPQLQAVFGYPVRIVPLPDSDQASIAVPGISRSQ